jgi:hypothetical protein
MGLLAAMLIAMAVSVSTLMMGAPPGRDRPLEPVMAPAMVIAPEAAPTAAPVMQVAEAADIPKANDGNGAASGGKLMRATRFTSCDSGKRWRAWNAIARG